MAMTTTTKFFRTLCQTLRIKLTKSSKIMNSSSVMVLLQRNNELKDNIRTRGMDRLISRFLPIHTISGRLLTKVKIIKTVHEMK